MRTRRLARRDVASPPGGLGESETSSKPARAFVGLGANLGDAAATLGRALALLDDSPGVALVACSGLYASDPLELVDQPPFLNAAAELAASRTPRALLGTLLGVEQALGRLRTTRYGPRTCDLDLLLYGALTVDEPGLTVPHPKLAARRFAIEPLLELDPALALPDGRTLAGLREQVLDQRVERLAGPALRPALQ
jgi:2-amino-4-hydroxy-6-hydroxymethyldihydropteridine diphosphokinase